MKKFLFACLIAFAGFSAGCEQVLQVANEVYGTDQAPSSNEMINGLKEALANGTASAVTGLNKEDGFFKDPLVRIPFPQEATFVANTLNDIGLGSLVDEFEKLLNRGAENAASAALPIFKSAITNMTFADAKNILLGGENAATRYFEERTRDQLYNAFSPHVKTSLDRVNATKTWNDITTRYNAIPLTNRKVETDLVRYATGKALDGLFLKIAGEEKKIREDPIARASDLLKKVFGYADKQKSGSK